MPEEVDPYFQIRPWRIVTYVAFSEATKASSFEAHISNPARATHSLANVYGKSRFVPWHFEPRNGPRLSSQPARRLWTPVVTHNYARRSWGAFQ